MTQEKVQAIIRRHRLNTLKLVYESLEKGWKTWLAQAAKLQLLRADREIRMRTNNSEGSYRGFAGQRLGPRACQVLPGQV